MADIAVVKCSRVFLQMGKWTGASLHAKVTLVKGHIVSVVSKKLEEARLMIIKPLLSAE